jgi:hypothetical protein
MNILNSTLREVAEILSKKSKRCLKTNTSSIKEGFEDEKRACSTI